MKLRAGDPWMPAPAYGATLLGIGFNLLVREIEPAVAFLRTVLKMEVVYSDPDFAVIRGYDGEFMLHADHTYDEHPFGPRALAGTRGLGVELRVYGVDPDAAEAAAREGGFEVLASATDKSHGLRETYIIDGDGYTWVPGRLIQPPPKEDAPDVPALDGK